jgi:hypothetical protein
MVAMRASWRKGLSGAVSAIVIAVVLVAGLASASYINLTAARYNEAQMQEALRQARLGSELIRIHIHSTDGAIDSPPRITFVNAWGYESRIIQLVVVGRNMEPRATIDLRNRPIVLPPGARLTIDPAQIGLSYPTFKRMADEIRSVFAYTEAGNSFGSTWGFPREDNMAGRTVATTVTGTTYEVWSVPSFTTINDTYRVVSYTTLGAIPNATTASIKAVEYFEKGEGLLPPGNNPSYNWVADASQDAYQAFPRMSPAIPDNSFTPFTVRLGSDNWPVNNYFTQGFYWKSLNGWLSRGPGPIEIVEAGIHQAILNYPVKYRLVFTMVDGGGNTHQITIDYRLGKVAVNPALNIIAQETTTMRPGLAAYMTMGTHRATQAEMTCWYYNPTYGYSNCFWTTYVTNVGPGAYTITAYNNPATMTLRRATAFRTCYEWYPGWYWCYSAPRTYDYGNIQMPRALTIVTAAFTPFRAAIQPIIQPLSGNGLGAIYAIIPPGDYTVERYYYIDSVQYQVFSPPPPPETMYLGEPGGPPEPPRCDVVAAGGQTPSSSGSSSGGSLMVRIYFVNCRR